MWSFVGFKHNKQWIWLALDSDSREIVGMHVWSRDHAGAEALWESLPPVYRQCAVCYTDFWSAYEQTLPQNRHRAVGEESEKTNHIERFNLTLMPGHGACRACCSTYSRLSNQIIVLGELISEATFLCRGFQTIAGRSSRNLN